MGGGERLKRLDYITAILGSIILFIFWLVVATFPSFFFFNPLASGDLLRRFELIVTTVGWISISTLAPFLLFMYASGVHGARHFLPITALIYPIGLFLSHLTVYIQSDVTYISYLRNFPIFIFTDVLLPVLILFIWHDLKERPGDGL